MHFFIKLCRRINHDERMNPIDFGVKGQGHRKMIGCIGMLSCVLLLFTFVTCQSWKISKGRIWRLFVTNLLLHTSFNFYEISIYEKKLICLVYLLFAVRRSIKVTTLLFCLSGLTMCYTRIKNIFNLETSILYAQDKKRTQGFLVKDQIHQVIYASCISLAVLVSIKYKW